MTNIHYHKPTLGLVHAVLALVLDNKRVSTGDVRKMGYALGDWVRASDVASVIRTTHFDIPLASGFEIVTDTPDVRRLAKEYEPDAIAISEYDNDEDEDGKKDWYYFMTPEEIDRYHNDREGQANDYREIRRLNQLKTQALQSLKIHSRLELPIPDEIWQLAHLNIPGNTDGSSKLPEEYRATPAGLVIPVDFVNRRRAANDDQYEAKKNGDL